MSHLPAARRQAHTCMHATYERKGGEEGEGEGEWEGRGEVIVMIGIERGADKS